MIETVLELQEFIEWLRARKDASLFIGLRAGEVALHISTPAWVSKTTGPDLGTCLRTIEDRSPSTVEYTTIGGPRPTIGDLVRFLDRVRDGKAVRLYVTVDKRGTKVDLYGDGWYTQVIGRDLEDCFTTLAEKTPEFADRSNPTA